MVIILILALALDQALGDPPNAWHPVAWTGRLISFLEKGGRRLRPAGQFLYGVFITLFTAAVCVIPLYFILLYIGRLNLIAGIIVAALVLKITFSLRGLRRAALKIRDLMRENKTKEARHELRALVGRDTGELTEAQLASAAVESAAEGLGDSLVAPLCYFLIFALPGAVAYRVVNTLDAMIGYHGQYEHLGKFAARLDDVLNYIPARLAAFLLILAASIYKRRAGRAWQTARREHHKTESPNAGWPMAAMAGALGVRLEKPGHYVLGEGNEDPGPETINQAVRLLSIAAAVWMLLCLIAGGIQLGFTA